MTRYERWSLLVQAVGYLLVILWLLAAWVQLRQLSEQNRMLVHQEREGSTLGLDRVFIEYPELRPYFYEEKDIAKEDPLYNRVVAVAEMHLDTFDYALKHAEDFQNYEPFPGSEKVWMQDMFRKSPILRHYLQTKKAWYSERLQDLVKEAMPRTSEAAQKPGGS
jgi:hypothetical protein